MQLPGTLPKPLTVTLSNIICFEKPQLLQSPANRLIRLVASRNRGLQYTSFIGTAGMNGIDLQAYLRHVSDRIADHPINRVDERSPWNVADALAADSQHSFVA